MKRSADFIINKICIHQVGDKNRRRKLFFVLAQCILPGRDECIDDPRSVLISRRSMQSVDQVAARKVDVEGPLRILSYTLKFEGGALGSERRVVLRSRGA